MTWFEFINSINESFFKIYIFFLVQVLRNPPKSLTVSLPLENAAHEELQGPAIQL